VTQAFLAGQETVALRTIGQRQDTDSTLLGDQSAVKTELLQQPPGFIQVKRDFLAELKCHSRRNSSGHPLPAAASILTGSCTALERPCMLSSAACKVVRNVIGRSKAASTAVSRAVRSFPPACKNCP